MFRFVCGYVFQPCYRRHAEKLEQSVTNETLISLIAKDFLIEQTGRHPEHYNLPSQTCL